jgi:hypothetical protein
MKRVAKGSLLAGVLQFVLAVLAVFPAEAPARVPCPVGAVTRIVVPEPLQQLTTTRAARQALGLSVERTRPQGVLRVEPARAGAAVVELRGPTLRLRLVLETVALGAGAEVRLARDGSVAASVAPPGGASAPAATPPVSDASPPPIEPVPVPGTDPLRRAAAAPAVEPAPAALAPTPVPPPVVFDLGNLMRATPVPIGRREGLPGQQPMVLVDALRGDTHLWLRFTLEDGAAARVRSVGWEAGPIETYTQEPVGRDLRVVVQLPRASVTRKTRVVLVMESGAEYRFALSSGTLTDLWRKLFN